MLKWYAETFKLTEKQMTAKALRRLWILTGIGLLILPVLLILEFGGLMGPAFIAARVAHFIILIPFLCLVFSKFFNRFWSRDKYLDEWEKERKHEAMAFAFQVLMYVLGAVILFSGLSPVLNYGQDILIPEFDLYTLGLIVMGVMTVGLFTMHIYLLITTKPIDSLDELRADLSIDEVI